MYTYKLLTISILSVSTTVWIVCVLPKLRNERKREKNPPLVRGPLFDSLSVIIDRWSVVLDEYFKESDCWTVDFVLILVDGWVDN